MGRHGARPGPVHRRRVRPTGQALDVQPDDAGGDSGPPVLHRFECDLLDRAWLADRAGRRGQPDSVRRRAARHDVRGVLPAERSKLFLHHQLLGGRQRQRRHATRQPRFDRRVGVARGHQRPVYKSRLRGLVGGDPAAPGPEGRGGCGVRRSRNCARVAVRHPWMAPCCCRSGGPWRSAADIPRGGRGPRQRSAHRALLCESGADRRPGAERSRGHGCPGRGSERRRWRARALRDSTSRHHRSPGTADVGAGDGDRLHVEHVVGSPDLWCRADGLHADRPYRPRVRRRSSPCHWARARRLLRPPRTAPTC